MYIHFITKSSLVRQNRKTWHQGLETSGRGRSCLPPDGRRVHSQVRSPDPKPDRLLELAAAGLLETHDAGQEVRTKRRIVKSRSHKIVKPFFFF
jgi:hypothetical protein